MKKAIILSSMMLATHLLSAASLFSQPDHIVKAKRSLIIGISSAGAGVLMTTYSVLHNNKMEKYWDSEAARHTGYYTSGLTTLASYNEQMSGVKYERDRLQKETNRNYMISGAFFLASAGFFANSVYHSAKSRNGNTSVIFMPTGVYASYRF